MPALYVTRGRTETVADAWYLAATSSRPGAHIEEPIVLEIVSTVFWKRDDVLHLLDE